VVALSLIGKEATPPAQHAFVFTTPHRAANVARSSRL
jgi:hypothetical protein